MIPGEYKISIGKVFININRKKIQIIVKNNGDRPIQVGSHYHFYEVNYALKFNRKKTIGFRLNIPSGTSIRFEPGQERKVSLVQLSGKREVYGFNSKIMGALEENL